MILNPKEIVDKGYIQGVDSNFPFEEDKQLSSNGIDLRINTASLITGSGIIGVHNRLLPHYDKLFSNSDGYYYFEAGKAYVIEMFEKCIIPEDAIALVMHRSSLNRCGCFITGSIYDAGYNGVIGATLRPSVDIQIQRGSRVAQIIFMKADSYKIYDGIYKGEVNHNDAKQRVNEE